MRNINVLSIFAQTKRKGLEKNNATVWQISARPQIKKRLQTHYGFKWVSLIIEKSKPEKVSPNTVRNFFKGMQGPKNQVVFTAAQELLQQAEK